MWPLPTRTVAVYPALFQPILQPNQYETLRGDTVNLFCILQLYSDLEQTFWILFFFQVHESAFCRSLVHQSCSQVHFLIFAMPQSHSITWPLPFMNWFCSLQSYKHLKNPMNLRAEAYTKIIYCSPTFELVNALHSHWLTSQDSRAIWLVNNTANT